MNNFFEALRTFDFNFYLKIYAWGANNPIISFVYYFFAKYGIIFFFLSFIYLILKKKVKAFFCSFLAMGIAGFFDFAINLFWRRPSPYITHASFVSPHLDRFMVDDISFPSSHTYIVFAIAASVFLYGHKKLGLTLFVLALVVAISRVGSGLHYPSDVLAGTVIGILSGVVAYLIINKAQKNWN